MEEHLALGVFGKLHSIVAAAVSHCPSERFERTVTYFSWSAKGEIFVCSPFPDLFSIPLRDLSGNLDAAVITR